MKIAGIILIGVGIIGGVATLVGNVVEGNVLGGILYGTLFIYITICTALAIIISADVPKIEGDITAIKVKNESISETISQIKTEIVFLKRENKELKEVIIDLQNKLNNKDEEDN